MSDDKHIPFGPDSGQLIPANGIFSRDIIYAVPMREIMADETFNVRGAIKPLEVMELAKDIEKNGLNQPITVQPYDRVPGKKYRVIAGHRRLKAHELIPGATHVRALVMLGLTDMDARVINLTENLHRQDLNIMQEAQALYHLKMGGWGQDEVAAKIGKSRGWVQARYYLLELPQELQDAAAAGIITQFQIKELWSLNDYSLQMRLFKEMKDDKLLGRKKKTTADKILPGPPKKEARTPDQIFGLQEQVQDVFGVTHPLALVMGWCAGVVNDRDVHECIAQVAKKAGKHWMMPEFAEAQPA